MCGIAGFSLNQNSKVNARALAHHLLAQIEYRGSHASGFAYKTATGGIEVYKDKVAGSNLPIFGMPRNTKTAILHTRFATHGPITINENNHPVMSPDQNIALVHNGVIWNHQSLRYSTLKDYTLPQVDTSVIPALIQHGGTDALQQLSGDAAVAWLDNSGDNTLHIARIEGNPINWTQLYDGSVVFASTEALLHAALTEMGLEHGRVFEMNELDYFKMNGGVIEAIKKLPENAANNYSYANQWRNATSGGHGSTATTTPRVTHVPAATHRAVEVQTTPERDGSYISRTNGVHRVYNRITKEWEDYVAPDSVADIVADADRFHGGGSEDAAPMALEAPAAMWDDIDEPEEELTSVPGVGIEPSFYTVDRDGNLATYVDLDELETTLLFHAGRLVGTDVLGKDESKWVNFFSDVGSFGWADDEMISWVKEPGQISFFDGIANDSLGYIRDGVEIIKQMVGR